MKILRWIVFAFVLALFSAILPTRALPANATLTRMQALAASVKSPHVTSMQAQAHTAAWTVLVYMAADNDLESYGIADLNEMEFIGSTENLNIVVQVDRSPRYDSTNGDWSGARRYFMTQDTDLDNVASQDVGDLGVINMGDPATLKDFIDWGVKTYPAQHYGLVIWDHGGSWLGVGIDDSANDDALQLPELDSALKDSLADSKLSKFDLIGFDACLMGSIEVYRTVAPYASYAVASPELIPGQGWDYAGAFGAIASDPTVDAPTFGHAIVDSFNTFYTQVVTNYDYFSLGLVDLSQTGGVVTALDSFTGTANTATSGEAIARARSKALVFGAFDDPQYADIWAATDMLGFMQQVQTQSKDTKVIDASNAVIDAGQKMVMYHLSSKTLSDSQGVSIYFPRTSTFFTDKNRDTRYGQDTPSDLNPWQKFLGTFYSLFSGSNPSALITSATSENNQALFKLSFNTGGLSDALFYIALKLNNKPILVDYRRFDVGDFPSPGPVEPTVTWAKSIPVVSDGTTQVPALLIKDRRNPLRGIINGTFVPQNGDPQVPVQVLFDLTDPALGKSISVWGIRDSLIGPMPSQINVQPGDKFIPAWLSLGANGQINNRSSETILTFTTQPLTYFTVEAPQAVYEIGVQAVSPAGVVAVTTTKAEVSSTGVLTVSPPDNTKPDEPTPESPTEPPPAPTTPPPPPATSSPSNSSSSTGGSPAGIDSVSNSSVTSEVGQPLAEPFKVKIVDSNGHGVSGQTVTFTAPSSGPSGTFAPPVVYAPSTLDQMMALLSGANTALAQNDGLNTVETQTDSSGTATSTTFTANTTAGSYVVTATTSSGLTLEFHITNSPGAPTSIEAVSGTPQSTEVETEFGTALQALVTDQYGNSVPGVTVTFDAFDPGEGPGASFEAGEFVDVSTNNLGLATAPTLTANPIVGTYTVYASFVPSPSPEGEEPNPTAYFELSNTAGGPAYIYYSGEAPSATEVTQAFNLGLDVIVYDSHFNPVTGGSVTFTAPGSAVPGATFDNADPVSNAITVAIGSDGHALSGPIHANTHSGTFSVVASIDGVEDATASTDLTSTAGAAANLSAYAGTPQSTMVDTAFATSLQALVTDEHGNPVPNVLVTFGSAYGGEGPGASYESSGNSDDIETTGPDGIATASTLTASTLPGSYSVSASADGVTDPVTFELTNLPGDPETLDLVGQAEEENTTVGTAFLAPLEVAVYDHYGNPVPGALIHWSAPLSGPSGSFADPGELTGTSAPYREAEITTDSSGSAVPSTFTADQEAGSYAVRVTYDDDTNNIHLELSSYLTNNPDTVAYVTTVNGASGQSAVIGDYYADALAVKVTDQYFNPIAGVTVNLSAPSGQGTYPGGSFTDGESSSGTATGVTDSDGIFTPPDFRANYTAGSVEVTVDTPEYTVTEPVFELTNLAGDASSLEGIDGAQSTTVGQAFSSPLRVKVVDIGGNGVSGIDVTFTAPDSETASGTFADTGTGTETDTSDADGIVTSSTFTANTVSGSNYAVQVSSDGLSGTFLSLTNLPDVAKTITHYSGWPQQTGINTSYASPFVAFVTDQYGNPVEGVDVVFNAPSSDASGTFSSSSDITETVATGADGLASSSSFSANGTGGDYSVTASVSGIVDFASFPLTNLNPAPTTTDILPSEYQVNDNPIPSITINGTNFINGVSVPQFNGEDRTATSTTSTQIVMALVNGDLTTLGNYDITVKNPFVTYSAGASHDGVSNAQTFTVKNPTPNLTSVEPNPLTAGDTGGNLVLTGSNFAANAAAHLIWDDGTPHDVTLDTTVDSDTQITAAYSSANIADGKVVKVEVRNPAPVDAASNQVDLTINNPFPHILVGVTPNHAIVGDDDLTITVETDDNSFVPSSKVVSNTDYSGGTDEDLTTTFVDSNHLTAVIPQSYFTQYVQFYIKVVNPAPGGGTSDNQTFTVYNQTPTITSVSPSTADQGDTFELTINGTGFVPTGPGDTVVTIDGHTYDSQSVTVDSATKLRVQVSAADTETAGDKSVIVSNVNGFDGTTGATMDSNSKTLTVLAPNPTPTLDSISPTSVCVGASGFTLTATGSNFVNGAEILWDGASLTTSYVDPNTLTATVDSAKLASAGTPDITVHNPAPPTGGLTSGTQTFTISDGSGTLEVTDGGDSGPGTLRQALADACVGQSIHLGTDVTLSSPITLDKDVTMDGATEGYFTVTNGGFDVSSGATVTFQNLGLTNAPVSIASGANVTMSNVTISGASNSAIVNDGTLHVDNSFIHDNGGGDDGGGIHNNGELTLDFVELQTNGNGSGNGGGLYNGGSATATVTNSTFQDNNADKGGGVYNSGTFKGVNLTFWDTTANSGAGVYNAGGTSGLSFIVAADTHGGPLLTGDGIKVRNSILPDAATCGSGDFTSTFSGVNFGDDSNCSTTFTGPSAGATITNNTVNNLFYFRADSGSTANNAVTTAECTDTDGNTVTDSVNGVARPSDGACEAGPGEVPPG